MPARVNIVVEPGWILERCAKEIKGVMRGVTINSSGASDLTYYIPSKRLAKMPARPDGIAVGFFTHGFSRSAAEAHLFDAGVAMNRRMEEVCRAAGLGDVTVIRPGTEAQRRVRFGVCGRTYRDGRKCEQLVAEAVAAGFDFVSCGSPKWPCPRIAPTHQRDEFYAQIDYLVVTSLDEGGPIPVVEALAHGIPVIAPDVGWCWEFPVIRYERGSWPSLHRVLSGLTDLPTWQDWGAAHRALFRRLLAAA